MLTNFPRGTPVDNLLLQDVAAYVPDTDDYLTVRDAGGHADRDVGVGSLGGSLRGWSAIIYGLRYSGLSPVSYTYTTTTKETPTPPPKVQIARCDLSAGSQQFTASPDPKKFFANLAACLFNDEEDLVTIAITRPHGIPDEQGPRCSRTWRKSRTSC